jgi:hypothetical protein
LDAERQLFKSPSWYITRTTVAAQAPTAISPPQAFQNYICAMFGSQLHLQPAVMPSSFFHAQDLLHCSFDAPKAHRQAVNSITYSMRSGHFFFEVEVSWGLKVEWRDWKCFGIVKCDCLFVVGKYCMLIGRRNNIVCTITEWHLSEASLQKTKSQQLMTALFFP